MQGVNDVKVADGVEMLGLPMSAVAGQGFIHPVLLWDKDAAILVDTGYPGQMAQLREAVEGAGVPFGQLSGVIITHHDIDHIGNLPGLAKELPQRVEIMCHADEKPFLEGKRQATKVAGLEANLKSLPEQMQEVYQGMKRFYDNCRITVDRTLADGESLPWCGGIRVIHTPGHTPGHLCLYLEQSRTLISGDALTVEDGVLKPSAAFTNYDDALGRQSLRKLVDLDIESVICYHGGLYSDDVSERLLFLTRE